MRTNDQIVAFSQTVPGFYEPVELARLCELTRSLSKGATVVEIGVECGRSASVFLQCPENWSTLHLVDARTHNDVMGRKWTSWLLGVFQGVDSFGESHWDQAKTPLEEPSIHTRRPRSLGTGRMPNNMIWDLEATSEYIASRWKQYVGDPPIDLLHIDADHGPGVWDDCRWWLPKVKIGGYAVFHDYARKGADGKGDVFPSVTTAVNYHLVHPGNPEDPILIALRAGLSCEHGPAVSQPGEWLVESVVDTQIALRRIG